MDSVYGQTYGQKPVQIINGDDDFLPVLADSQNKGNAPAVLEHPGAGHNLRKRS